jgi:hypothetical protein
MPHNLDRQKDEENPSQPHHHQCGNLFGCGEEQGTGVFREDIKDATATKRAADRLLHSDEMNQEQLDGYLTARGRSRRRLLGASTFMAALAGIGPWFTKLTNTKLTNNKLASVSLMHAADSLDGGGASSPPASKKDRDDEGRVHGREQR